VGFGLAFFAITALEVMREVLDAAAPRPVMKTFRFLNQACFDKENMYHA
jgi:hypothetical protein